MADENVPDLGAMLESGWSIESYSVCLMAMGATSHHILLRNGPKVSNYVIVMNGGVEQGRGCMPFSPPMPKKKGWFG